MEKKRLLIIDDENDFLTIAKINLEQTGKYEVMVLPSAKDIISAVHSFHPALILLDALMPTIGGIEACEMLNSDPQGANIPTVMLSALDKDQDKLKAYKVGVVDYLVKPIEKDELSAKIEKVLESRT